MPKNKRKRLKYTSSFIDRHGKERWIYRRVGFPKGYFREAAGTKAFLAEYDGFNNNPITGDVVEKRKTRPRSINDLLHKFYCSNDFRGNAQLHVLAKRRATLDAFAAMKGASGQPFGDKLVATLHFVALDRIIANAAVKKKDGTGGPFAALFLKKQLSRLLKYAIKIGWRADNPMAFVSYAAPKTKGFHSITEAEIEQYRSCHPLGSNPRLAMEILLWTGKRRSDGRVLGKQNYRDGMMWGRDQKTGKEWWLPIAAQLKEAIDAMPPHDNMCFLVSSLGKPYGEASLGNMFRKWFDQAGLPHCTAHGLRKAISRRLAEEIGMGNTGIKAVTLHTGDSEVAIYTAAADQKRLAEDAIERISTWEMSNLASSKMSNHSVSN